MSDRLCDGAKDLANRKPRGTMLIVLGVDGEIVIVGIICTSSGINELSDRLLVPLKWGTAFAQLCS